MLRTGPSELGAEGRLDGVIGFCSVKTLYSCCQISEPSAFSLHSGVPRRPSLNGSANKALRSPAGPGRSLVDGEIAVHFR